MAKASQANLLPDPLFHVLAALIPEFGRVLEKCQLNGVEFVALLYLKHQGKRIADGRIALVQQDFRERVLRREFNYSPGDTDIFLRRMEEKGLLQRQRLTPSEKHVAFGTPKGRLSAVVLCPGGAQKIDEVKVEINRLYSTAISRLTVGQRAMIRLLVSHSEELVLEFMRALDRQRDGHSGNA